MARSIMLILFLFLLLLPLYATHGALNLASPECPYTGHVTCLDGVDNNHNGLVDEAAPAPAFVSVGGGAYSANIKDCLLVGSFATASDATSISGTAVSKPVGTTYLDGEIACAGNFASATYKLGGRLRSAAGSSLLWVNLGSTNGSLPTNDKIHVAQLSTAFVWQRIQAAGVDATYVLNGDGAFFIKAEALAVFDCLSLVPVASSDPFICPGEAATTIPPDYTVLKMTSPPANAAAMAGANQMQWTGYSTTPEAAPVLKIVHSGSKFYFSLTQLDDGLRSTTTSEDDSTIFNSTNDRIEFAWRNSTATTARDANTFRYVCNLQGAIYTSNYPGNVADSTPDLNSTCSVTLNGDLDGLDDDTSYTLFGSFDAGFTITDGMQIRADVLIFDSDTAGNSVRQAKSGSGQFNTPANWGVWTLSGDLVTGGDTTAPMVGPTTVANITQSAATGSATTNEASTCRFEVALSTTPTNFAILSPGAASQNGIGSDAVTTLNSSTNYVGRITCADAAGNRGISSATSNFTTLGTTTAQLFVGPTATGTQDCLSSANRCLFGSVWAKINSTRRIIEAAAGTYTGSSNMLAPTSNITGTATNRITVRCITDGACLLNGQGARTPIKLDSTNAFFTVEGFNATNKWPLIAQNDCANGPVNQQPGYVVSSSGPNNIIRRVMGYDGSAYSNNATWHVVGLNNLVEDSAAFGQGRYASSSSQSLASNVTWRRHFSMFNRSHFSGPKLGVNMAYNNTGETCENCINMWHAEANTCREYALWHFNTYTQAGINDGLTNSANAQLLASIGILRNNLGMFGLIAPLLYEGQWIDTKSDNVLLYNEGDFTGRAISADAYTTVVNSTPVNGVPTSCGTAAQCNRVISNITKVGFTTSDSIAADYIQSNIQSYTNVAAIPTANKPFRATQGTNNGAWICFQTIDRKVDTSKKLWPLPFDVGNRLANAIDQSGRSSTAILGSTRTVTGLLESYFGTIPAVCKN